MSLTNKSTNCFAQMPRQPVVEAAAPIDPKLLGRIWFLCGGILNEFKNDPYENFCVSEMGCSGYADESQVFDDDDANGIMCDIAELVNGKEPDFVEGVIHFIWKEMDLPRASKTVALIRIDPNNGCAENCFGTPILTARKSVGHATEPVSRLPAVYFQYVV